MQGAWFCALAKIYLSFPYELLTFFLEIESNNYASILIGGFTELLCKGHIIQGYLVYAN